MRETWEWRESARAHDWQLAVNSRSLVQSMALGPNSARPRGRAAGNPPTCVRLPSSPLHVLRLLASQRQGLAWLWLHRDTSRRATLAFYHQGAIGSCLATSYRDAPSLEQQLPARALDFNGRPTPARPARAATLLAFLLLRRTGALRCCSAPGFRVRNTILAPMPSAEARRADVG